MFQNSIGPNKVIRDSPGVINNIKKIIDRNNAENHQIQHTWYSNIPSIHQNTPNHLQISHNQYPIHPENLSFFSQFPLSYPTYTAELFKHTIIKSIRIIHYVIIDLHSEKNVTKTDCATS